MRFKTFLAEIKASMPQYDAQGLIDDLSVYNWVKWQLKTFGNLPLTLNETVLKVKNYQATLPEEFNKIFLIAKCEPDKYRTNSPKDKQIDERFWIERVEETRHFDPCDDCSCWVDREKHIIEKVFVKEDLTVEYSYKEPQLLKLKEGFNASNCDTNCVNKKYTLMGGYDVSLYGQTLNFDFPEGYVYVWYKGLPVDEEGLIEIPDTKNGHLKLHLDYYVKSKILEEVILNSDNTGNEAGLLQRFDMLSERNYRAALTELKAKHFTMEAFNRLRRKMRLDSYRIR